MYLFAGAELGLRQDEGLVLWSSLNVFELLLAAHDSPALQT